MPYYLSNYKRHTQLFLLDQKCESFKVSPVREVNKKDAIIIGVVKRLCIKLKPCYVGFFIFNKELILSIGDKHWNVSNGSVTVKFFWNKYPGFNCFQVIEENKIVFQHYYLTHFLARPINWLDLFNYIPEDDEDDDLLMWVGNVCNDKDWKRRAKEEWVDKLSSFVLKEI